MYKYPIRKNTVFNKYYFFSKHTCSEICHYNINVQQNNNSISFYFSNNNQECLSKDTNIKSLVQLEKFIDTGQSVDGNILNLDDIINIIDNKLNIIVNFPIINVSQFTINIENNTITIKELLKILSYIYKFMYKKEEETSSEIEYIFVENCYICGIEKIKDYIKENNTNKELKNNEKCPVCLDKITDNYNKLNCGHYIHTDCINEWINETKNSCPICRQHLYICENCNGNLEFETHHKTKVIPKEHRSSIFSRNLTDGVFNIHNLDFEDIFLSGLIIDTINNYIYLNIT